MLEVSENLNLYDFKNSLVKTLVVDSPSLKDNPLKDSHVRVNPLLVPKDIEKKASPVVLILAGFSGNGPNYFSPKTFQKNAVEVLGAAIDTKKAPRATYVFVDAMTSWGGSQFINSSQLGNYEDYLVRDLVRSLKRMLNVKKDPSDWCICGGSSGGYGALHLASKFPNLFGWVGAIAPDSYFELSLLPELMSMRPVVEKLGGFKGVLKELKSGKLMRRRDAHQILNVIAMSLCYGDIRGDQIVWPFNEVGLIDKKTWSQWLTHDPIHFLKKRANKLKNLKGVFLEVGRYDQYFLQYGTRQIHQVLKQHSVKCHYDEFEGNHFDIGDRRIYFWEWMFNNWS